MKDTVVLKGDVGAKLVDAEVFGDWAVHGAWYSDGSVAKRGHWCITYVEAGEKLPWNIARKADAVDLAKRLNRAGIDGTRREEVRAAVEMIRDEWWKARGLIETYDDFGYWWEPTP